MNWSVIIGIFGTLAGFALSYLAFARNSKKDSADAGKESGTVLTEIGYIKANTDDIKRKQEKQDENACEDDRTCCEAGGRQRPHEQAA